MAGIEPDSRAGALRSPNRNTGFAAARHDGAPDHERQEDEHERNPDRGVLEAKLEQNDEDSISPSPSPPLPPEPPELCPLRI